MVIGHLTDVLPKSCDTTGELSHLMLPIEFLGISASRRCFDLERVTSAAKREEGSDFGSFHFGKALPKVFSEERDGTR